MKKVAERNLKVNYFEKEGDIWIVESLLVDGQHDISMVFEINMAQIVIVYAKLKFNRFPMKHCTLIEDKAV